VGTVQDFRTDDASCVFIVKACSLKVYSLNHVTVYRAPLSSMRRVKSLILRVRATWCNIWSRTRRYPYQLTKLVESVRRSAASAAC
jgi:hypothetical protein